MLCNTANLSITAHARSIQEERRGEERRGEEGRGRETQETGRSSTVYPLYWYQIDNSTL